MSKVEILEYFNDINYAYNNSSKKDTLSNMLDEMEQEIRNKTIDEFAEKIKEVGVENFYHCNDYYAEDCNKDCDACKYGFKTEIDEIAKQMKGRG